LSIFNASPSILHDKSSVSSLAVALTGTMLKWSRGQHCPGDLQVFILWARQAHHKSLWRETRK